MRCGEEPGQPFGGVEGGHRLVVTATRQLEQSTDVPNPHVRRGVGFRSASALGVLDPAFCLLEAPLPDQSRCECHVGGAGGRVVGPAVPFGQFDRLPAELLCPRKRPEGLDPCLVCQAGELQIGSSGPVRERDALLEVPLRLVEPTRPGLGDAEVDQR